MSQVKSTCCVNVTNWRRERRACGRGPPLFFFFNLRPCELMPCTTLQGLGNVLIFLKSSKHTTRPPQYFSCRASDNRISVSPEGFPILSVVQPHNRTLRPKTQSTTMTGISYFLPYWTGSWSQISGDNEKNIPTVLLRIWGDQLRHPRFLTNRDLYNRFIYR